MVRTLLKSKSLNLHVHICQKYIQIQHGYEMYVSEKDTCRYAQTYARDTAECISDVTRVYDIYTLYVYVSQSPMSCIMCICICMSDTFNRHTCRYIQIRTLLGSSYLYVSVLYRVHVWMYNWIHSTLYLQIHTDMHSSREFISVCICLYFSNEYIKMCISCLQYTGMHICTPTTSAYPMHICTYAWVYVAE
jgi:hypothetical protein